MTTTLETQIARQTQKLVDYLPQGRAFGGKAQSGTVTRSLLEGLGAEMIRSTALIQQFRDEILPDLTTLFLDEWESALGIPDDCFSGAGSDDVRRRDILLKLVSLGVQTGADFVALANTIGVNLTIKGGSTHGVFPFEFPAVFFPSAKDARFTIIVDFTDDLAEMFPLSFPIVFGDSTQGVVTCLFEKLKPANVDLLFTSLT